MSQERVDLDNIKICRNENAVYGERDHFEKRLNMSVPTWMKLYASLETPAFRVRMRDISILIAKRFRNNNVFISEHGTFDSKFALSAPYHYFLTTVDNAELTHRQSYSVTFHEIIDYTTGEIVDSLHINFMAEMLWLANEYMLAAQVPNMTVVYGIWIDSLNRYDIPFDIDFVEVEMPEFGSHHSKISILKYKDNKIRIIISTANLYAKDWQTRTQGLWISPFLPLLPEDKDDTDGESPTNFKSDFIQYLDAYKQPEVLGWEALIHRTDCSAVNVFFIASVPGSHEDSNLNVWGHRKLHALLSKHAVLPSDAKKWPIVAQSSSIGVFGENYESWISSSIVKAMCREKDKKIIFLADFKFIYPSKNNYNGSYDEKDGSCCLTYRDEIHLKQQWIKDYLYQWKSENIGRNLAMPHMKCYTRISPDESEIPWFVLTSSNLSKGAWGKVVRRGTCQVICNYEAGVVFFPQFIINQNTFPIQESLSTEVPVFILPYDLPLTPYEPSDEPYSTVKCDDVLDVGVSQASNMIPETSNIESSETPNEDTLYVEDSQNSDETLETEELKITEITD